MSHFYGYLTGNRGTLTRCGSRTSGINAHLRSWDNDVYVTLKDEEGKDILVIQKPKNLKVQIIDS